MPGWRDHDLVTTVRPMTTLFMTLLLTWSGLGAWLYLDGRACECAPRVQARQQLPPTPNQTNGGSPDTRPDRT